jgi:hypothetical protein
LRRLTVLLVGALLASLLLTTGQAASASGQQLVGAFGKANIGGQEAIVHTVSVVAPGENASAVARDSLAAQGARPISKAEFNLTGMHWGFGGNGFDPAFKYIAGSGPWESLQDEVQDEFEQAFAAWAGKSNLALEALGASASTCPSLVRECPGAQIEDGSNDVGWVDIKGRSTLGVTWYTATEADIALDLKQKWFISPTGSGIDIRTVILHEFGHGLGLGHSTETDTVMNAYYGGVFQAPGCDDIEGLIAIYGGTLPSECASTGGGGGTPTELASPLSADVTYERSGGRNRDLIITVKVVDSSTTPLPVAGASEWIELTYDGTTYRGGPVDTDTNGENKWRVRRAPGDTNDAQAGWTAVVYLMGDGLTCDPSCTVVEKSPW